MIIRKSTLLLLSTVVSPSTAYFAQVNNAHVEFIAASVDNSDPTHASKNSAAETTDNRPSLQHNTASSLWAVLENALESKSDMGYAAPKIMELFEEWVTQFAKEYQGVKEKSQRMLIWLENHVLIETHNAEKDVSFTLGHNEYSDLTHAEFKERMKLGEFASELINRDGKVFNFMEYDDEGGVIRKEHEGEGVQSSVEIEVSELSNYRLRGPTSSDSAVVAEERKLQTPVDPANAPASDKDEKDWHTDGFMGPIRQQGMCGACWSFSAIGAIEVAMAIDTYNAMSPDQKQGTLMKKGAKNDLGLVIPLSEQNLIDCDTLHEKGCNGGL